MNDIVTELRQIEAQRLIKVSRVCRRGADEIERLREERDSWHRATVQACARLAEAERLLRRARAEIEATLNSESYYFGGDETIDADIDAFLGSNTDNGSAESGTADRETADD